MATLFYRFLLAFLCCFFFSSMLYGQNQYLAAPFEQYEFMSEKEFDQLQAEMYGADFQQDYSPRQSESNCNLNKQVYGWHPYWVGTAYENYDFSLLSTFSYFNYALNPNTGSYNTIHAWKTTNSIDLAKAAGCRVELCVTNFGADVNNTFLTNPDAWNVFVDTLINLLDYRDADGVNIDFEGIAGSNRDDLTAFMQYLSNRLHTERPGSTVTMAIFSVDWNDVFDVPALAAVVDAFVIMGYGYHYSGSTNAGPNAPLHHGSIWGTYTLSRSVDYYLSEGMPHEKLLLGLPYYGIEWETVSGAVPSNTIQHVSSRTYSWIKNNYIGTYTPQYDPHSMTQYISFTSGGINRQCWYDDETTIAEKLDMIRDKGIAGMGIWALGYDNGYTELWDVIRENYTDCFLTCNDQHYDSGGPLGIYRNNENNVHTFTDNSPGKIRLAFTELDLELNYDYLYVHDGPDINSPLIATLNGSTIPDPIISSGNTITIHFVSDGATLGDGWSIDWSVIPGAAISIPSDCVSDDLTASFSDQEFCGSGVKHSFYLPTAFDGSEWQANPANGFFNDHFDNNALHTNWMNAGGTWNEANGLLTQTDESDNNTNLYAVVNEDNSAPLLYHWKMKIDGTGTNRRAGIHFFSDNPGLPNRGNSYFIYYRVDSDKMQFYKVVNDTWTLVLDHPVTVNAGQWYDCKVVFDPISGVVDIYRDDVFLNTWTDASPHTTGGGISPRTGNCQVSYDDMKVYKSRNSSVTIPVGNTAAADFNFENATPMQAAGQIESILLDNSDIFSPAETATVHVDFSAPAIASVNDGEGADIDAVTETSSLAANWTDAVDTNSDISRYWYKVGTIPGGDDIVPATDAGLNTSVVISNLALEYGTTYYITVQAENCAGLLSAPVSSNGQTLGYICALTHYVNNDFTSSEQLTVSAQLDIFADNLLGGNTVIQYQSGSSITLEAGFEVQLGSDFHAYILSCDLPVNRETAKKE